MDDARHDVCWCALLDRCEDTGERKAAVVDSSRRRRMDVVIILDELDVIIVGGLRFS